MTNESDSVVDQFFKLDHPLVDKVKELCEAVDKAPNTDAACKFLADWKKNNPEEAKEIREFLWNFGVEEVEDTEEDSACPLCGEDGGTTCGMPGCQY